MENTKNKGGEAHLNFILRVRLEILYWNSECAWMFIRENQWSPIAIVTYAMLFCSAGMLRFEVMNLKQFAFMF